MPRHGRIENLRPPWKPGESGNPSGRPKQAPVTDRYRRLLELAAPASIRRKLRLPAGASYGDALAAAVFQRAILGDARAVREITDRVEGKALARHGGPDGGPLQINLAARLAQLRAASLGARETRQGSQQLPNLPQRETE